MARKADKSSVRQRAFAVLTANSDKPRSELLDKLMVDFGVSESYAKTLYQHHRAADKEAGNLTEVYQIRDHKDGATVDPYVFTKHVSSPSAIEPTTKAKAIKAYVRELQNRTKSAEKL